MAVVSNTGSSVQEKWWYPIREKMVPWRIEQWLCTFKMSTERGGIWLKSWVLQETPKIVVINYGHEIFAPFPARGGRTVYFPTFWIWTGLVICLDKENGEEVMPGKLWSLNSKSSCTFHFHLLECFQQTEDMSKIRHHVKNRSHRVRLGKSSQLFQLWPQLWVRPFRIMYSSADSPAEWVSLGKRSRRNIRST
jgi:hypothetical protein